MMTLMPLEVIVFQYLHSSKFQSKCNAEWRATSDEVVNQVYRWMTEKEHPFDVTMDQLKRVIIDLEEKVRRCLVRSAIHIIICSLFSS
jgi:hypothetical protein